MSVELFESIKTPSARSEIRNVERNCDAIVTTTSRTASMQTQNERMLLLGSSLGGKRKTWGAVLAARIMEKKGAWSSGVPIASRITLAIIAVV
jgi:hypothetical protein